MICKVCHCRQLEDFLELLEGVCGKCKSEMEEDKEREKEK